MKTLLTVALMLVALLLTVGVVCLLIVLPLVCAPVVVMAAGLAGWSLADLVVGVWMAGTE